MENNKNIESRVSEYYDKNTSRFLRFGSTKNTGAIHRRLYSSGQTDQDPANLSDSLILEAAKEIDAERILDLGCGVGATISFLEKSHKADYTGLTLSPVQFNIAGEKNIKVELGSYLDSDWYREKQPYDLIYAIESLQHNTDHNLLVDNIRNVMKRSARFIVIDDFINEKAEIGKKELKMIARFKRHWHSHGFTSIEKFVEAAETGGFELIEKSNLSELMKKPVIHPKLRAAGLSSLSLFPINNAALDNLIGGGTLTQLQQLKISGYYKLVFRII